jgi:hypothetical protein
MRLEQVHPLGLAVAVLRQMQEQAAGPGAGLPLNPPVTLRIRECNALDTATMS